MLRGILSLGTAALLLAPAVARAQQGWVNVPGQGWAYQGTVAFTPVLGCSSRIGIGTCTVSGNSLLFTRDQKQLTLTWHPAASPITHDPETQQQHPTVVDLGTWRWTGDDGFVFPSLQPQVVEPLITMQLMGGQWFGWGFTGWASGSALRVGHSWTDYTVLPSPAPHPVTGYTYLFVVSGPRPNPATIDGSTDGELTVQATVSFAPEPSTFALLGGGVALLLGVAHRRRRRA